MISRLSFCSGIKVYNALDYLYVSGLALFLVCPSTYVYIECYWMTVLPNWWLISWDFLTITDILFAFTNWVMWPKTWWPLLTWVDALWWSGPNYLSVSTNLITRMTCHVPGRVRWWSQKCPTIYMQIIINVSIKGWTTPYDWHFVTQPNALNAWFSLI